MTRQQRRHALRHFHGIPFDAEGNVLTLTRADLELAGKVSETLKTLLERLSELTDMGNDTETAAMIHRDAGLIAEAMREVEASGLNDGLIVSRDVLIPMQTMLGCWARFSPVVDVLLRDHAVELDTRSATHLITGMTLPDAADMVALEAKLLRIADALNGQAGVRA